MKTFRSLFCVFLVQSIVAQGSLVTIDPTIQKFIGDVSKLDRSKYFLIHPGKHSTVTKFL